MKEKAVFPARVRDILICQQRQIGDVLLTEPAIRALGDRFSEARIHFFTEEKCRCMLENHPRLHRVWSLTPGIKRSLRSQISLYAEVFRHGFDIAVNFQSLPRCRFMTLFSRAPIRVGAVDKAYLRLLYTHAAEPGTGYAVKSKFNLLAPLGISWQGEAPALYLTSDERDWAETFLADCGLSEENLLVTVDVTHRRETRRWPWEAYAETLRRLGKVNPKLRFLLLYGPGEKEYVQQVRDALPGSLTLFPEKMISVRHMAACIDRAQLHLGNCSMPRHLAVALGTPSVVVMGSTPEASWTYPSSEHIAVAADLACRPCNDECCATRECLLAVTPGRVVDQVLRLLDRGGPLRHTSA